VGVNNGTGPGVIGQSTSGAGVLGNSGSAAGVAGVSQTGTGVHGTSQSGYGVYGTGQSASGVYGTSAQADAVLGVSSSSLHAGVSGQNTSGSPTSYGVYGSAAGQGKAGYFVGDCHVTGTHFVDTDIVLTAQDCAEEFDIAETEMPDPGTVMVLDNNGCLAPSADPYDKRVAGVISGAGEFRPGLILGRLPSLPGRLPVALVGKVYCKVDASYAPIGVGDLLTTSPTRGHAMKAEDPMAGFGAVIGKALRPLGSGQGLLPILVALQ
jgi:hypothetical protein